jgi:hypothetical protein
MKSSTKILIAAIVIPSLACILFYFISKSYNCIPDCNNKTCGKSDGCFNKCKLCPKGSICNGKSCQKPKTDIDLEKIKGICYFDIDGTLITANGDRDKMMKHCLDNNFAIGIITASNRTVDDICDGDNPIESWMPKILCEQFNKNKGKMFNSTKIVSGSTVLPSTYPVNRDQGYIKGFDMTYGRDLFYPNIPDKCIVLFDDQKSVIEGVKEFGSNLETQCANTTCGLDNVLGIDNIKNKVFEMQENGCK